MDYKNLNDNELICFINENNEEAKEILFKKYMPLVKKKAMKYKGFLSSIGLDENDLTQEGLLAVDHAIECFDEEKNITFYTFVNKCIDNRILNIIMKNKTNKFKFLNEAIPFENEETWDLNNVITNNKENPEEMVMNNEQEKVLVEKIKGVLTEFESQVFELKSSGLNYQEIAIILDKSPKSIDNTLQRIKGKLKGLEKG